MFTSFLKVFFVFLCTAMIVVHGLFPQAFHIDEASLILLAMISIPLFSDYLKKLKFFGAEFEFKDEIRETKKLVDKSRVEVKLLPNVRLLEEKRQKERMTGDGRIDEYRVFNLEQVRELSDTDPTLSLAALRIELEKKLVRAVEVLGLKSKGRRGVKYYLDLMAKQKYADGSPKYILEEQKEAFLRIIDMCNQAVHGQRITKSEAKEVIILADELDESFSFGYSIDLSPDEDFERHGHHCKWEHCIEHMPSSKDSRLICPVFGHDCPGGEEEINKCQKR